MSYFINFVKKLISFVSMVLPILALVLLALLCFWSYQAKQIEKNRIKSKYLNFTKLVVDIPIHYEYTPNGGGYTVHTVEDLKVTAYNNLPEQTDDTANIGASNRKVYEGSVAVSRDLIRKYSIKYGDVICLFKTDTCYKIEDTMNKRYDNEVNPGNGNRVDIFRYSKEEALKTNFKTNAIIIQQR